MTNTYGTQANIGDRGLQTLGTQFDSHTGNSHQGGYGVDIDIPTSVGDNVHSPSYNSTLHIQIVQIYYD